MADYTITIDLPNADDIRRVVNGAVFPRVKQAIRNIAEITREDWINAIKKARLWSGEKTPYMASITVAYPTDLSAVISSNYKYAEEIETGRPPRDLKRMLQTSKKIRFAKTGLHAGQRYLIIPLRHNVSGMSADTYQAASSMAPSVVTGKALQNNGGTGARVRMRQRATYNWGDRMNAPGTNQHGMVRFDTSSKKSKSSTYLTFRVMGEWSAGWIIPAQPGQYIAKKVAEAMQPAADEVIKLAFAEP
jgi:hypothetical protein